MKSLTPIEMMIDKACGYTPTTATRQQSHQERIAVELFDAVQAWYENTSRKNIRRLRAAWESVASEDKRVAEQEQRNA